MLKTAVYAYYGDPLLTWKKKKKRKIFEHFQLFKDKVILLSIKH